MKKYIGGVAMVCLLVVGIFILLDMNGDAKVAEARGEDKLSMMGSAVVTENRHLNNEIDEIKIDDYCQGILSIQEIVQGPQLISATRRCEHGHMFSLDYEYSWSETIIQKYSCCDKTTQQVAMKTKWACQGE